MQAELENLLKLRGMSNKEIAKELKTPFKSFRVCKPASKITFRIKYEQRADEIPKYLFKKRLQ